MRSEGGSENASNNYSGIMQGIGGQWHAEIEDPQMGKRLWLGSFNTAREAALAYDQVAMVVLGPAANFNLPECLQDQSIFEHPMGLTLKVTEPVFVNFTSGKAMPGDMQATQHSKKVETLHAFHSLINSPGTEVIHCDKKLRTEHAGSLAPRDEPVTARVREMNPKKTLLPLDKWIRFLEERDNGEISEKNTASAWLKLSI